MWKKGNEDCPYCPVDLSSNPSHNVSSSVVFSSDGHAPASSLFFSVMLLSHDVIRCLPDLSGFSVSGGIAALIRHTSAVRIAINSIVPITANMFVFVFCVMRLSLHWIAGLVRAILCTERRMWTSRKGKEKPSVTVGP